MVPLREECCAPLHVPALLPQGESAPRAAFPLTEKDYLQWWLIRSMSRPLIRLRQN
eukprot:COSAG02_NODE_65762_length_257_cov_0.651899_1_plen_55_part_10